MAPYTPETAKSRIAELRSRRSVLRAELAAVDVELQREEDQLNLVLENEAQLRQEEALLDREESNVSINKLLEEVPDATLPGTGALPNAAQMKVLEQVPMNKQSSRAAVGPYFASNLDVGRSPRWTVPDVDFASEPEPEQEDSVSKFGLTRSQTEQLHAVLLRKAILWEKDCEMRAMTSKREADRQERRASVQAKCPDLQPRVNSRRISSE